MKVILQYFIMLLIYIGIIIVLIMIFFVFDICDEFFCVMYVIVFDFYVVMCFIFVLLILVQFVIVYLFIKKGYSDICMFLLYVDSFDDENVYVSLFLFY